MIYLFESELPENKSVYFALTHIYGIGKTNHFNLQKVRVFCKSESQNLSKDQIIKLIKTIETLNIELASDLKNQNLITKTLVSIRSSRGLPVRGPRTHTNAKKQQA
jgi:ribosomal protein S13